MRKNYRLRKILSPKKRGLGMFKRFPKRRGQAFRYLFMHKKYGGGYSWCGYSKLKPLHIHSAKVKPFSKKGR